MMYNGCGLLWKFTVWWRFRTANNDLSSDDSAQTRRRVGSGQRKVWRRNSQRLMNWRCESERRCGEMQENSESTHYYSCLNSKSGVSLLFFARSKFDGICFELWEYVYSYGLFHISIPYYFLPHGNNLLSHTWSAETGSYSGTCLCTSAYNLAEHTQHMNISFIWL